MSGQVLTRQQKRALARQKHHKYITIGSYYKATSPKETLLKHPLVPVPMFEVVKVFDVTPNEVLHKSPFGMKATLSIEDFLSRYELVDFSEIDDLWNKNVELRESLKGQTVKADELLAQLRNLKPDYPSEEQQEKE